MALVGTFAFSCVLSFISGIIYAVSLGNGWYTITLVGVTFGGFYNVAVAACVWQFFTFVFCGLSAFFCFKAGGGGTASA